MAFCPNFTRAHLKLNVARAANVLFHEHAVVLERTLGLAFRRVEHFRELLGRLDDAHTLAAAAVDGLDQHCRREGGGRMEKKRDRVGSGEGWM